MPRRARAERMAFLQRLKPDDSVPLAVLLGNALRLAVSQGRVLPGDLIPSERELGGWYGFSQAGMRKTLQDLAGIGLIRRIPRVGYALCRPPAPPRGVKRIGLVFRDILQQGSLSGLQEVRTLERRIGSAGHVLMIGGTDLSSGQEDFCVRRFREAGMDALVVTPATAGGCSAELGRWISEGRPTVLSGHPGHWLLPEDLAAQCDQVDVDNQDGVRQLLQYLFSLGHEEVAMISAEREPFSERIQAFRAIMRELRGTEPRVIGGVTPGRAGGREGFASLRKDGLPTAVACTTDDLALGVIDAARETGIECPRDISVGGFNNESMDGPQAVAALTTVDISHEELAGRVWELLEARLNGTPRAPGLLRTPVRLVIRGSCAAPGGRDHGMPGGRE